MITFKVKSELYGQTDCVVNDIGRAIKTGSAPCGDGCDYKFTPSEIEQLKAIQAGKKIEFKRTIAEIQQTILDETGIKTSVKKGTGSMRGYVIFSPMFQNREYPKFQIEWLREFKERFPKCSVKTMFTDSHSISIYHGVEPGEPINYKRESKPKTIEQMKVREWGSKNSQMRLDKKSAGYAKRRKGPNGDKTVKYW